MARPLQTGKQSIDLASPDVRLSRIRRDPPPAAKQKRVLDPDARDQRDVVVGILAFALSLIVILFAFGSYSGWSPQQYTIEIRPDE